MKGDRMEKRSSFGNIMRRRLSDITNTQSQSKFVGLIEEQPRIPECTQDLIDQLLLVRISFSFFFWVIYYECTCIYGDMSLRLYGKN
jgi:hypothetical protein